MSEELTSSYFQSVYFPVKFFGLGIFNRVPQSVPSQFTLIASRAAQKKALPH